MIVVVLLSQVSLRDQSNFKEWRMMLSLKDGGITIKNDLEILNLFSSSTRYQAIRELTVSPLFHIE